MSYTFSYTDTQDYIDGLLPEESSSHPLGHNIQKHTKQLFSDQSNMLLGQSCASLLCFFMQLLSPKLVLELGTFTGYSTAYLASELAANASLITIDNNISHVAQAKQHLQQHPNYQQIQFINSDATEFLFSFENKIDFAFIDANKKAYITQYKLIKQKLSSRGIIIIDNAFFHGEVFQKEKKAIAKAIHEFNMYVANDDEMYANLLAIRDGIWIISPKRKR